MKAQLLAMSGCKTEKEFYKKYPTPEDFEKEYGKELKKAKVGTLLKTGANTQEYSPISYQDNYDTIDYSLTGTTQKMRDGANYKQTMFGFQNQSGEGMPDILGKLTSMIDEDIPMSQNGFQQFNRFNKIKNNNGFNPGDFNPSPNIGYSLKNPELTSSGFQEPNIGQKWSNNNSLPFNNQSSSVPKSIGYSSSNFGKIGEESTLSKIGESIGKFGGPAGDIINGISNISAQKEQVRVADQANQLAHLASKAKYSYNPEEIEREYVRPEDMIVEGNQLNFTKGRGNSNIGKNGLNVKNNVPKMFLGGMMSDSGGGMPWDMLGNMGSNIAGSIVGNGAGADLGGAIGGGLGMAFGPMGSAIGSTLGTFAGGLIDKDDNRLKNLQKNTNSVTSGIAFDTGIDSLKSGVFNKNFKNGGEFPPYKSGGHLTENYINNDGFDPELSDLNDKVQTLWGGELEVIAKNPYLSGSGEIGLFKGNSHENGGIGISFEDQKQSNTSLFKNGKNFNDPSAEVEGRELIHLDNDGNAVVTGDLTLASKIATSFNPKLAPLVKEFGGQKIKNITKSIAINTNKINKKQEQLTKEKQLFSENNKGTKHDMLKEKTLDTKQKAYDLALKIDANKLTMITDYQNQINDTTKNISQHLGYPVSANKLASKGIIAEDKNNITKDSVMSRNGIKEEDPIKRWNFKGTKKDKLDKDILGLVALLEKKGILGESGPEGGYSARNTAQGKNSRHDANQALDIVLNDKKRLYELALQDKEIGDYIYNKGLTVVDETNLKTRKKTKGTYPHEHIGYDYGTPQSDDWRNKFRELYKVQTNAPRINNPNWGKPTDKSKPKGDFYANPNENLMQSKQLFVDNKSNPFTQMRFDIANPINDVPKFKRYTPKYVEDSQEIDSENPQQNRDYSPWINLANSVLGEFTPSNAMPLDYNQISDAVQMLATNQVEPVQAQQFVPQLDTYYSQSQQDSVNEITAAMRAAQKMSLGNVGAEAFIAGQAYEPLNKIKGEEFRINQALADKVFTNNRATMNDAQIKNLGILDQQYQRQALADSNKRAEDFAARKDLSSKYLQNALENRKMQVAETYSKYRFDNNGRIRNWNGLANFNVPQVYNGESEDTEDGLLPIYGEDNKTVKRYTTKKETKTNRNGSIVKSFKNS